MTLSRTLQLLCEKENANGAMLNSALALKRNRHLANLPIIQASDAYYLPAVNSKARIKWGRVFIEEVFKFFNINEDEDAPCTPLFFVTLADKSHLTSNNQQDINLGRMRRKLGGGLMGLNYIGMIEPGYFNNIYDQGQIRKNVVSWHGHFIVWGVTQKQLTQHLKRVKQRFIPIMPSLCAVHKKKITLNQFGYKLWYMIKSPRKEYSIGKRRKPDKKTGSARYKQNSRDLRPGHRVALFNLLQEICLDQLAMAGGNGRKVLKKIKSEALRDYRSEND